MKNLTAASAWKGIAPFLPIGLLIVGGLILYNKFSGIGGVIGAVTKGAEDVITGGNQGQAENSSNAEKAIAAASAAGVKNGVVPSAYHHQIANDFFDIINEVTLNIFSTTISDGGEDRILKLYESLKYTRDTAAVYIAYGVRTVNNRQSAWLGFIWDETTGTLKEHIMKYTTEPVRTRVSHNIDQAILGYLS